MLKVDCATNRRYIQTEKYWQDPHNKKMSELADKMMDTRMSLSRVVQMKPHDFFQQTDGTVKPLPKTGLFKFLKSPDCFDKSFVEFLNKEYVNVKKDMLEASESIIKNIISKK